MRGGGIVFQFGAKGSAVRPQQVHVEYHEADGQQVRLAQSFLAVCCG